jgi:hypothetical protein
MGEVLVAAAAECRIKGGRGVVGRTGARRLGRSGWRGVRWWCAGARRGGGGEPGCGRRVWVLLVLVLVLLVLVWVLLVGAAVLVHGRPWRTIVAEVGGVLVGVCCCGSKWWGSRCHSNCSNESSTRSSACALSLANSGGNQANGASRGRRGRGDGIERCKQGRENARGAAARPWMHADGAF